MPSNRIKTLAACAAAVGVQLFLIAPGGVTKRQKAPFYGRSFAHRGLHSEDQSVPENSLKAFELAAEVGYGMEPYVTDAVNYGIRTKEMIPAFKEGDYYKGIDNAVNAIIGLASGAYKSDRYTKNDDDAEAVLSMIVGLCFIAFILVLIAASGKNRNGRGGSGNGSFWRGLLWGILLSGNGHGGRSGGSSWGGSGGGSWGSSGGFGGFGGGHFGGGGGSSKW